MFHCLRMQNLDNRTHLDPLLARIIVMPEYMNAGSDTLCPDTERSGVFGQLNLTYKLLDLVKFQNKLQNSGKERNWVRQTE